MPLNLELGEFLFLSLPPQFLFPAFQNNPEAEAPSCRYLPCLKAEGMSSVRLLLWGGVAGMNIHGLTTEPCHVGPLALTPGMPMPLLTSLFEPLFLPL